MKNYACKVCSYNLLLSLTAAALIAIARKVCCMAMESSFMESMTSQRSGCGRLGQSTRRHSCRRVIAATRTPHTDTPHTDIRTQETARFLKRHHDNGIQQHLSRSLMHAHQSITTDVSYHIPVMCMCYYIAIV